MSSTNTTNAFDEFNWDFMCRTYEGKTVISRFYPYNQNFNWRIILLHGIVDGRCTCGNFQCKSPGKHPMFKKWQETGTADPKILEDWGKKHPSANFGVMTGSASNLFVLDIDPRNGGNESLEELGITPDDLQWGFELETGGGGRHYYFSLPAEVEIPRVKDLAPGVDIKCEGGFVVGPGSRHASGEVYRWVTPSGYFMSPPAVVPDKILCLLRQAKARKDSGPLVADFEEGARNESLMRVAGAMVHNGHSEEAVRAALLEENRLRCRPPLPEDEVSRIAESASRYEPDYDLDGQRVKPITLPDLPEVMGLDPAILPDDLRPYLVDSAERTGVPLDFVAVPAFVVIGSLLGRQVGIRPRAKNDWSTFANNYSFIVAPPGSRKSAAIDASVKLLWPLEERALLAYRRELPAYDTRMLVFDMQKKALQKLAKDPAKSQVDLEKIIAENVLQEPEKPVRVRYYTNDTTAEALTVMLEGNPNGGLVVSDELNKFLAGLDATHQKGARSFYNTVWEAKLPYQSDRIGRGNGLLQAVCVSILGSIQPAPLADLVERAYRNPGLNDGFLHRFQLAVFPDAPASNEGVDREPDYVAAEKAQAIFNDLTNVEGLGMSFGEIEDGIPYLRFTPEAQVVFNDWYRANDERARQYGERSPMSAHLRKYPKLFPGLCLIIHMVDDRGPAVGFRTAEKALALIQYFESHARRIFTPALSDGMLGAKHLLGKIREGRLADRFSLRDTYKNKWAYLTDKRQALAAVKILVDYGWIFELPSDTPGPGGPYFQVNPEARER